MTQQRAIKTPPEVGTSATGGARLPQTNVCVTHPIQESVNPSTSGRVVPKT